ncbi:penicillin-binding protein 2 [Sphaerisporangium sp. TRM90804]|uniref:peptidoglycan D,D-transpeptidase FtsI family protein n=1 Tax=Sphaerisporangium sp. TRM90804 TaxID=3031113 RepID=UPI00244AE2E5|nr:penicillin-binding protein 2 [Sphaerisporangium sp. TRM90804]MDH2428617.1 penicillin-binding protein 2 [Sphaerisporangium sp. TRM90804]
MRPSMDAEDTVAGPRRLIRRGHDGRRVPPGRDGGGPPAGSAPNRPRPPRPPAPLRLGNPSRRINIGLIGMAVVLSLFAGRLVQLQGLDSKVFEAKAASLRVREETLPARRGPITDVNGHELAVTVEAREISADPSKVPPDRRDQVATALASSLGVAKEDIAAKLAQTRSHYTLLARNVPLGTAKRVLELKLDGVAASPQYQRLYPGGTLASGLVGFVGDDGTGLTGVESTYDKPLGGKDGRQTIEIGGTGQRIPMTRSTRQEPVAGQGVRLTVDRDIQWAAQEAIARQVKTAGARSGSVIVMDVRTGQVLAMANAPEVDLNKWQSAAGEWRNRAVSEVFEPGSTNKVITAAAALEGGVVRPETMFEVKDNYRCADRVLRDAHAHPPENLTFTGIIAESSNVGTMMVADKIGDRPLFDALKAFGFGARSGGGFYGEEAGLLPAPGTWSGSQRCTISFGQGVSVTALQMAGVYQTIANGGVRITPHLVAGTVDERRRFVPAKPAKRTRVVSARTAKDVTTMLEAAVTAQVGTGSLAAIKGYRVAGKTGTAMRYDESCQGYCGYTSTFVGFTPADAPRLVVLAVVQAPENGHFGGEIAAPVFKEVMTFALKSRKIPPTGVPAPSVRIGTER